MVGYATGRFTAPPPPPEERELEPIKIGMSLPLTGWGASYGDLYKKGALLAIDEINAKGGILGRKIEYIILDAEDMTPEKVRRNFERLGAEGVDAIICGYHAGVGGGIDYETAAEIGVPYLHVNTFHKSEEWQLENPGKYWMCFQCDVVETHYATVMGWYFNHLVETGQWNPPNRKVAIITSDNPYGIWIAEHFRDYMNASGWEISYYDQAIVPCVEWGPFLSHIRADPPAIIFNTDYAMDDIASFTLQFLENPTNSLLYLQAVPGLPEFFDLVGDKADGALWSVCCSITPDEVGNAYKERFKAKWGHEASWVDAQTYDEIYLYAHAVSLAGDPKNYTRVCEELKHLIYRGVLGTYRFHQDTQVCYCYPVETGDLSLGQPFAIFQVHGTTNVQVGPPPYELEKFHLPYWCKQ